MFDVLKGNPLALLLAVIMHVIIVAFLVVGVDWREKPKPIGSNVKVVQAKVVDQRKLDAELNRLKETEQAKQAKTTEARRKEEKKLADLKKRRQTEKRKLAKIEKERKAREKAEKNKRIQTKKKVEAEKKRIALEKKKKAEQKKKKLAEEKKRKAAEKVAAKKKAEAETKRKKKAEAEKKRKQEAVRKKAAAEKKRKAAAAKAKAEQAAREAELAAQYQAEQDATEKNQVIAEITAKVERNWLQPPGTAEQGLSCTVRVRLGATGSVLLVNVVKSSGNGAFDRSVEAAVRKADPLPMPKSSGLLAQFRNLEFVFAPNR